jgi:hypothetical protein
MLGSEHPLTFSPKCLLGNWQEDRTNLEHRLKDFVAKKESGRLVLSSTTAHLAPQVQPIELRSAEPDGPPCYGDVVLVRSLCNGGVLALSMAEKPLGLEGEHVSLRCAHPSVGATARTTFHILSYEGKTGPVRYDDKVVLASAGPLFGEAAVGFLHTESPTVGSQASDQQVTIRVLPAQSGPIPYSAAFIILPAHLNARLGLRGQPVGADDAITLVHAQSGKCIAGLRETTRTDFGLEQLLTAKTMLAKGTVHQLTGEQLGTRHLSGYGVKPEYDENKLAFVRAAGTAPAEQ